MATVYDIGDVARISASFTDTGGSAVDPSVVRVSWIVPGTTTVVNNTTLQNPSVGSYYIDVDVTSTGVWWYQIASTGTFKQVEEDYFIAHALQVSTG